MFKLHSFFNKRMCADEYRDLARSYPFKQLRTRYGGCLAAPGFGWKFKAARAGYESNVYRDGYKIFYKRLKMLFGQISVGAMYATWSVPKFWFVGRVRTAA